MTLSALADLLRGVGDWPVSQSLGASPVAFPLIDALHILFQSCVVGSIALLDLRLLGWALPHRSVADLARRLLPLTWGAFAGAAVTGVPLFMINAAKFVDNRSFAIKLGLLALAGLNMLLFHAGPGRRLRDWEFGTPPLAARVAGALSLVLWIGVVVFGRYLWYPWSNASGF